MKCFLLEISSQFHVVSSIYIRQYVNSSLRALTKMAKIGTWRIITNLQYFAPGYLDWWIEYSALQARATEYTYNPYYTTTLQLYQPSTSMYIQRWFSPSDSSIQIEDIPEPVKCGQDLKLGILYSTPPDTRYRFHVVVSTVYRHYYSSTSS